MGPTSDTYTPVADDVGDYLQATASYDDGEGRGQERPGDLRQRGGGGAGKERAGLYGWSDRDAQHPEEHARRAWTSADPSRPPTPTTTP